MTTLVYRSKLNPYSPVFNPSSQTISIDDKSTNFDTAETVHTRVAAFNVFEIHEHFLRWKIIHRMKKKSKKASVERKKIAEKRMISMGFLCCAFFAWRREISDLEDHVLRLRKALNLWQSAHINKKYEEMLKMELAEHSRRDDHILLTHANANLVEVLKFRDFEIMKLRAENIQTTKLCDLLTHRLEIALACVRSLQKHGAQTVGTSIGRHRAKICS